MTNFKLYEYIKRKRADGYDWNQVLRFMVKDKKVTSSTTVDDIKSLYKDVAARLAVGEVLEDGSAYDEAYENFKTFINKATDYFESFKPAKKKASDEVKIVCISDLHVPFVDKELLTRIVEKEQGADILIVNGDYLNADSLSDHAKFKQHDLEREIAEGRVVAEYFASKFGKVIYLDDNHVDARFKRWIGNDIPADRHFLVSHPYDVMLKDIQNTVRAKDIHQFKFGKEIGHCAMVGDILFSHGFVSGKHLQSAVKIKNWHNNWRHLFGHKEPRVVVHGHVHSLGVSYEGDFAYVQAGTLASLDALEYSLGGECKGTPPQYGYTTFFQKDGVTDLTRIGVHKLA